MKWPDGWTQFEGQGRCVGVELEFAGLTVEQVAGLTLEHFPGRIDTISPYELWVCDTPVGNFRIEIDLSLLKDLGRELSVEGEEASDIKRWSAEALASASRLLVPVELVTPPLSLSQLDHEFSALIAALRSAGAKGTGHSTVYAFGTHLNPQIPGTEPGVIRDIMRAFACSFDYMSQVGRIDFARWVTPFINRYPEAYEKILLDSSYQPGETELIDDYLANNATRNRALDMLPLFCWLDAGRVKSALPSEKINPRPTFHYRLPNCEIDTPGWSVTWAMGRWLQIERLAQDTQRLEAICQARLADLKRFGSSVDGRWATESAQWLKDR